MAPFSYLYPTNEKEGHDAPSFRRLPIWQHNSNLIIVIYKLPRYLFQMLCLGHRGHIGCCVMVR